MKKEKMSHQPQKPIPGQLLRATLLAGIVFFLMLIMLLVGFEIAYADRVYPGVYVKGIDLSGATFEEADDRLSDALSYTYKGKIKLTYEDQAWEAHPIELGFLIDTSSSARQAFNVGRQGWMASNLVMKGRAWFDGIKLPPLVYYDERIALEYLQTIAQTIDKPVKEASLRLENTDVEVVSGQIGKEVDISAMLSLIETALTYNIDAEIPLIVTETAPEVMDVSNEAQLVREILSEPLLLTDPGSGEDENQWTISVEDLAPMLSIRAGKGDDGDNAAYKIEPNRDLFGIYLNGLAPSLSLTPVNARFIFNDETRLLEVYEPAVIGRKLDIQASIDQIGEAFLNGKHEVPLVFEVIEPAVTDDTTGEELGIIELVHQETSYFYGSDAARVQNIKTASAEFLGLLVPPGATFSMAEHLNDISLDNGYAEALIIYGDQTIQGVGGGVCQVSTTLFRAAFFAGFPIPERHAHAYRVGYYEQQANGSRDPNLAGLDATVYFPFVDMKFVNDTENWLLMETYMGSYSLTWKFYSTKDNRTVSWETTGVTDVVPAPEPLCRENPDFEKDEIKKVDYAADGAKVNVTRTVYKGEQIHISDSFYTQFQPWREIWEYGPGTEDLPEACGN
jgi:vancomycin resistance protein YoaR